MNQALENILEKYRNRNGNIIFLLQETQESFGYIPKEAVDFFSERLNIAPSRFFGIVTFYAQFYLSPRGKNIVTTCCGTACHVKGSERLINSLKTELNLAEGESTTPDREITIEKVNCVGACSIAPVVIINKKVHGKTSADKLVKEIRRLREK
jgi:NADH:ubiquinone oxidoreductase subunit E